MIYGYCKRTLNEDGLTEMEEVSIAAPPETLRAVASFLIQAATELEASEVSVHWHRHVDEGVRHSLGCDLIVLCANPTRDDALPFCDEEE